MATLERLCLHESVGTKLPETAFLEAFDDLEVRVELVGDGEPYTEADAVASFEPRPEFLEAGWVHCIRAGYDAFDTDAYEDVGVPLTNSSGIHGDTVGELAVGYMLSLARLLHTYRDRQRDREWHDPAYERPFTISGERLCVVGLGTVGQGIAKRADALGMDVVGVRRSDDPVPSVSKLYDPGALEAAVADARFVALAAPHTPATEGMIDADILDAMRSDAYLLNVARGPLVDEGALITALEAETIAGAALDVFEQEPLPASSPLWGFENVIVTPHRGSATNRYHHDIAELVRENVRRFRAGESLKNRVA
ncbi:D-2-hydroxyacid dehydrogenase [Natronorubrum sp. JWXQ-INN-674]|uniref:D-2-hydroxyacid dehydrogenase n=1 Tax=Natronorubrum halalkaliphilum TaxID=2691917 RepID=A0A6B0VR02_9EURY|nr:D-2-hydroxyacid dehydrogenase [Natronorubrum halalkaliphilum]MXV63755.1 D-2-hydroxyacid dehydrogenase [Natronorubrum halalkaliphilum]